MERGILFYGGGKIPLEYQKLFCFAETAKSTFWDDGIEKLQQEVSRKEAWNYDEIMNNIIYRQIS